MSSRHFLYFEDFSTVKQNGFALLLSVIAEGLDVRLAGMVSKAVVKMCRCFYTCWMTRFNNRSLHVTLAVNETLEISQEGRPSVVSKQKQLVSNTKAGHKSRNLVNVGGFFLQTECLNNHFRPY